MTKGVSGARDGPPHERVRPRRATQSTFPNRLSRAVPPLASDQWLTWVASRLPGCHTWTKSRVLSFRVCFAFQPQVDAVVGHGLIPLLVRGAQMFFQRSHSRNSRRTQVSRLVCSRRRSRARFYARIMLPGRLLKQEKGTGGKEGTKAERKLGSNMAAIFHRLLLLLWVFSHLCSLYTLFSTVYKRT